MEAINGNCFILRDEKKEVYDGIAISEKAQVKDYEGTVAFIDGCDALQAGDRVHVPHYATQDYELDGREYVIAKAGDLFAKKVGDTYLPVNRFVKLRKCTNDHIRDESGEIALFMTEKHIEETNWCEIIDVADDCEWIERKYIGYFCVAPESDNKLQRILRTKDFCLHEEKIEFLTDGA